MKSYKYILARIFKPKLFIVFLLTILCTPSLIYIFINGLESTAYAYLIFFVSAYTLIIFIVMSVQIIKKIRAALYSHRLGRRFFTDLHFKGRLSLCCSAFINTAYALFEICCAIYFCSYWYGALGAYYLTLAAARTALVFCEFKKDLCLRQQLCTARICAVMLIFLNVALSFIAVQMVIDGQGYEYRGNLIFIMAFYAFYSVAASIINLIRYRKLKSPVLSASKVLATATALVSLLSLQTAMFAAFGGSFEYRRLMNALTSGAVCIILLIMAALMLVSINKRLKKEN